MWLIDIFNHSIIKVSYIGYIKCVIVKTNLFIDLYRLSDKYEEYALLWQKKRLYEDE